MNIWDQLGSLGSGIIDTGTDVVVGLGDNFTNSVNYNAANVDRMKIQNGLAVANFENEQARKNKREDMIQTVIYSLLFIMVLVVLFNMAKPFLKKS